MAFLFLGKLYEPFSLTGSPPGGFLRPSSDSLCGLDSNYPAGEKIHSSGRPWSAPSFPLRGGVSGPLPELCGMLNARGSHIP